MKTKRIECHAKGSGYTFDSRKAIKELLAVLNSSNAELWDTNEDLANQIDLTVCGVTAHINYFCPNTWEYVGEFCYKNIGFLIMVDELYKFPYYGQLLNRCCEELNCEAEDLDVL